MAGIERVEIGQLGLLDPTSIDAFAARYRDSGRPLHNLVNNAAIPAPESSTCHPVPSEKKRPQQGASTIVFAATSPLLAEIGGAYLKDNDIGPLDDDPSPIAFGTEEIVSSDVAPHAVDPESAQRLWELSERLLEA